MFSFEHLLLFLILGSISVTKHDYDIYQTFTFNHACGS